MTQRVYLAGPDLFFRDAAARYDALRALCAAHGLQGVAPVDGDPLPTGLTGPELAEHIYRHNMAHLRDCDAVLANVMPFRGEVEPDSGTVFEIGAAVALGKPVACHAPQLAHTHEGRIEAAFGCEIDEAGRRRDRTYQLEIEAFGQGLNLMLSRSCSLHPRVEDAVAHLARVLGPV